MAAPQYSIQTFSNTHVIINGAMMPKNLISAKVFGDTVILNRVEKQIWPNVDCTSVLNGDIDETFEDGHALDAFLQEVLRDPTAEMTARIVITVDGAEIQHPVIVGRTVIGIVIGGATKVDGFNVAGDKITFTDGTTVTVNQVVILIFEA